MATPKRLDFSSPPRVVLAAADDDDDDDAENNCPPLTRRSSQRQAASKRPASSDAAVEKEEPKTKKKKKSSSVKIWNEDDELTILKGLVDYRSREGIEPSTNWDGFFSFIKGLIHVKVSKEQLLSKIRNLKKRYFVTTEKFNNGEDPNFTRFSDLEAFKLSTSFWGGNDAECSNVQQTKKSVQDDEENANAEPVNDNEAAKTNMAAKKSIEDEKENADTEPVNDNEAAKTNLDGEPRHGKTDEKEPHDTEPGNNNSDGNALQELVDKITENKTFGKMSHDNEAGNSKSDRKLLQQLDKSTEKKTVGKKMSHDNEAGNSKADGKLVQQSTEKKTVGKKMSHDNEAGNSKADAKLVQQTTVDRSTENNTAAEESRGDDDDVCAVQEAFETMISQGLSEHQKKMQLQKLMNLETENIKELSNEWKAIWSDQTKLSVKKFRFSAKLVEAAMDG